MLQLLPDHPIFSQVTVAELRATLLPEHRTARGFIRGFKPEPGIVHDHSNGLPAGWKEIESDFLKYEITDIRIAPGVGGVLILTPVTVWWVFRDNNDPRCYYVRSLHTPDSWFMKVRNLRNLPRTGRISGSLYYHESPHPIEFMKPLKCKPPADTQSMKALPGSLTPLKVLLLQAIATYP